MCDKIKGLRSSLEKMLKSKGLLFSYSLLYAKDDACSEEIILVGFFMLTDEPHKITFPGYAYVYIHLYGRNF